MNAVRNFLMGLLSTAASVVIVFGAAAIAIGEGGIPLSPPAISSTTPQANATLTTLIVGQTPTPTEVTLCVPPRGWQPYTVLAGDTLKSLLRGRSTSLEKLMTGNCLVSDSLLEGTILYLPRLSPTKTRAAERPQSTEAVQPTAVPADDRCGPPSGWVIYIVQSGDTLYRLSVRVGASVAQIQQANCLGGSTLLRVGQQLYLPHQPAPLPTATRAQPSPTQAPRKTNTPPLPPTAPPDEPPPPTATVPPPGPRASRTPTAFPGEPTTDVPQLPTTTSPLIIPAHNNQIPGEWLPLLLAGLMAASILLVTPWPPRS